MKALTFLKNASFLSSYPSVRISALKGTGLDNLKKALLKSVIENGISLEDGSAIVTNLRHYTALLNSRESLALSLESVNDGKSGEFITVDLRSALDSLGEIIGAVTTEDILNTIFSKFCIGK